MKHPIISTYVILVRAAWRRFFKFSKKKNRLVSGQSVGGVNDIQEKIKKNRASEGNEQTTYMQKRFSDLMLNLLHPEAIEYYNEKAKELNLS